MLNGKNILVTGATGSFGKHFIATVLKKYKPNKLVIFSRDELKQYEMQMVFDLEKYECLRYFIGDVRDANRLHRAFYGMDIVIHAAALKQVPTAEYNPIEAIKTNIHGAENIINAAIDQKVSKVVALSTDKAVNPVNLYGATKLCADKLFQAGNAYTGDAATRFTVVRYGNVMGSRGSVVPNFRKQAQTGVLKLTDERMTRFIITLDASVALVEQALKEMLGGEVFVPKIPSVRLLDLAKAIAPDAKYEYVGIRPGEKLHEVLISTDDARQTLEFKNSYVIQPKYDWWFENEEELLSRGGKPLPGGFYYGSNNNPEWLSVEEIRQLIEAEGL